MPKNYENKSVHNKEFLESVCNDYPDQFFDWKVTVQFYCALHRCYCVLRVNGENIAGRHSHNIQALKVINEDISRKLFKLFRHSKQSRYNGFINEDNMLRINKINYQEGTKLLAGIEAECLNYYPISSAMAAE